MNIQTSLAYAERDQRIAELEAERDALKADAARYKWLRDEALYFGYDSEKECEKESPWAVFGSNGYNCAPISGSELDAAIDAAMGEK